MVVFCWVVAIIGAAFGAFEFAFTLKSANGAPQQAAGAGLALAYAIIPYCAARGVTEIAADLERKGSGASASRRFDPPPPKREAPSLPTLNAHR